MKCYFCNSILQVEYSGNICYNCPEKTGFIFSGSSYNPTIVFILFYIDNYLIELDLENENTVIHYYEGITFSSTVDKIFESNDISITPFTARSWLNRILKLRAFS